MHVGLKRSFKNVSGEIFSNLERWKLSEGKCHACKGCDEWSDWLMHIKILIAVAINFSGINPRLSQKGN